MNGSALPGEEKPLVSMGSRPLGAGVSVGFGVSVGPRCSFSVAVASRREKRLAVKRARAGRASNVRFRKQVPEPRVAGGGAEGGGGESDQTM